MAKEQPQDAAGSTTVDDDALRCTVCDHRISARAYRIEMSGAHEHTFVNPAGVMHHIGCFVAAPGCIHVGDPQDAFSWFPGWKWQIALCGQCRNHAGWIFRLGGEQFHGLVLASLR